MADQREASSRMRNDKESAPSSNQPFNKKRSFKGISLYMAANAEFRKCIVRNRVDEEVEPIKLEDLYYLPNSYVPNFREKIQPKMSCQLKDTFIALSHENLVKKTDDVRGKKNTSFPAVKPLTRRYLSLDSFSENSFESDCSIDEESYVELEKQNESLPKISSKTEQLLLRSKELDLNIEKLKIQKETPATRSRTFSRSSSSDDRHFLKGGPQRKYREPLARTMSLNLQKKYAPSSAKSTR